MNVSGGRKVPRRKKIPDRERIGASGVNTGKTHSSKGGWKNEEPGNHNGGRHGVNDNDLCPAGAGGRRQSAGAGLMGVPGGPGNGEPAGGLLRYRQGGEGLGRPACPCRGRRAELSHRGRHSVAVGCRNRINVRGTTAGKRGTGGNYPPAGPFYIIGPADNGILRGGWESRGDSSPPFGTILKPKGISARAAVPFFVRKNPAWKFYAIDPPDA